MNPSDKQWKEFNQQLMVHAKNMQWGLYRNIRFDMAESLRKEKRLGNALETYLEVCYLDLNGPMNVIAGSSPEILKEFPPFDPSISFIAPGVIKRITIIVKKLGFDNEKLRTIFLTHNESIQNSLKLPVTPVACWQKIAAEL